MPSFPLNIRKLKIATALGCAALFLVAAGIFLPLAAGHATAHARQNEPPRAPEPPASPQSPEPPPQEPQIPASKYDKAIFQSPIPGDQLAFLKPFAGAASKDLDRDKQFHKLMHSVIPNCMFHYGHDMAMSDALDEVLKGSPQPVEIREGRYLKVSGRSGPYLGGRGFMWIDLQDGIALGGFYFHPTNGEPTPTVTIFSKQVEKQDILDFGQLPPAFAQDLLRWSVDSRVPPVTPRYFITGSKKKILLEHDEDYCAAVGGMPVAPEPACEQMNADAADVDLDAAYYLDQTSHQTNATARMITDAEMVSWFEIRDRTCRAGPNPLRCHILMTRQRTHGVIAGRGGAHPSHR